MAHIQANGHTDMSKSAQRVTLIIYTMYLGPPTFPSGCYKLRGKLFIPCSRRKKSESNSSCSCRWSGSAYRICENVQTTIVYVNRCICLYTYVCMNTDFVYEEILYWMKYDILEKRLHTQFLFLSCNESVCVCACVYVECDGLR